MKEYQTASAGLLADLASAGYPVETVGDLRLMNRRYSGAIPILLAWLPQIEEVRVKREIINALAVRWARPSPASALLREYRCATGDMTLQWAVGNALSAVADDHVFDEVVALARDQQHGKAREMVVVALGNMHTPQAIDVLRE